jgi:hypothetical protein
MDIAANAGGKNPGLRQGDGIFFGTTVGGTIVGDCSKLIEPGQMSGEIIPSRIGLLDQPYFPGTFPEFELLFPLNGIGDSLMGFQIDEPANSVFSCVLNLAV